MAVRKIIVKWGEWWRGLSPGDLAQLSFFCFAVSLVLPTLKIGVDWPVGYQAAAMAGKDTLSLLLGISHDNYVQACAIGTAANLLFVFGWLTWGWPRVCVGFSTGAALLMLYLLLPLVDGGLLGGVQVGYVLWVGGAVLLANAGVRKRARRSGSADAGT